jgi:hypothetical protein
VSKAPDRTYLSDAIHIVELTHLVDENIPAVRATVERSNAAVVSAKMELDKQRRWLEGHRERYAEALKWCKRRFKRRAFISGCKKTALLPIQLLAYAWVSLLRAAGAFPRHSRIQNRIEAMEKVPRGRLQRRIYAVEQLPPAKLQNRIYAME